MEELENDDDDDGSNNNCHEDDEREDDDDDDRTRHSTRSRTRNRVRGRGSRDNDEKEKSRIQLQIAKIHNNIGCAYFEVGELEEARETFECTLEIQREFNESCRKPTVPSQLAMSSTICNLGKQESWRYTYIKKMM